MPVLEGLDWSPKWVSHLGCLKGCLDYLSADISDAWLFGGTGHAFIINLSDDLCPSGPTAWRSDIIFELERNLGFAVETAFGSRGDRTLKSAQQHAWALVREAIDAGAPCYGWELGVPEYYVIAGYEDDGYLYTGPMTDGLAGPLPHDRLGDTGIGMVEVHVVKRVKPAGEHRVVRDALRAAMRHAREPGDWRLDPYVMGPSAYETWAGALEAGRALAVGAAYNAAVWLECRRFALEFLREARERLGGAAVWDRAVEHYDSVCRGLETVQELYPFRPGLGEERLPSDERAREAVAALREVRDAEAAGLEELEMLAEEALCHAA